MFARRCQTCRAQCKNNEHVLPQVAIDGTCNEMHKANRSRTLLECGADADTDAATGPDSELLQYLVAAETAHC
jgi:hypothetical protein